jgi:hypothetical protein
LSQTKPSRRAGKMNKCEFCECDFPSNNYKDEKEFTKHVKECRHDHEHRQQLDDEAEKQKRIEDRALDVLSDYFRDDLAAAVIVKAIKIMIEREEY